MSTTAAAFSLVAFYRCVCANAALIDLRHCTRELCPRIRTYNISSQALASPAMGHWGTCPPPRLPASYFERTRTNFKNTNTENVQKQRDFCAIFINFWPIFCHFFAHSFPQV